MCVTVCSGVLFTVLFFPFAFLPLRTLSSPIIHTAMPCAWGADLEGEAEEEKEQDKEGQEKVFRRRTCAALKG